MKSKEKFRSQLQTKKKWKNSKIQISRDVRDIIHGYMMSDGYIAKNTGSMSIQHGNKQKYFVQWLYTKLEPVRTNTPIRIKQRIHSKTKKTHIVHYFNTRSFLHGFRSMWYETELDKNGKYQKKLPNSIDCFFNETFISIWFAGDGTKTIGYRGAKFEVTAFTVADRLKLKKLFLCKFNIQTKIISSSTSKTGNPQWALVIPANEYPKFRSLITKNDLIPTLFPYKLHKK